MDDVAHYRSLLRPIEDEVRQQPWDRQRPWRVASHVQWEGPLPVVDLHDLKAGPATRAVRAVLQHPPKAGAVAFVTGRGRHTLGATPVLKKVTEKALRKACGANAGWSFRAMGPARWVWISDRSTAPKQVTGGSGWGLWLGFLLLLLALLVGLWGKLG